MNKKSMRAFGIGILIAGASFSIMDILPLGGSSDLQNFSTPKGYELIKKEDLSTLKEEAKTAKEQLAKVQLDLQNMQNTEKATNNQEAKQEEKSGDKTAMKIVVQQGMNSSDISRALQDAGIIKNKQDFEQYLADQNLSSKIQIGEFEVNPSMTLKELAAVFTSR